MAELDAQSRSLQSLYSWFGDGKLSVNRRYQRKLVWTLEEKQKLVESVLKQYPIPAILLAEKEGEGYEIIDGLQRLFALMSFVEQGFFTLDGKAFDVARFATAQSRAEQNKFKLNVEAEVLTPQDVSRFLDYNMPVSVMRGASKTEIDEVFGRINTYGHRLSDQERRQAGVEDNFASLVRTLACDVREDVSAEILDLADMPSISIDLPMSRHGYDVVAADVFWVQQGILRSTDLRDSMDEQCIADIAASVLGGTIIERSKDALDAVYDRDSVESRRISLGLDAYGAERFRTEFKYCVEEVDKICEIGAGRKLRSIVFGGGAGTNAFPSVFAVLMIALHEALIRGTKTISDYAGVQRALTGLYGRLDTSRASTAADERRRNVDTIKGLIAAFLVDATGRDIYGEPGAFDIENLIRRSQIESGGYELKQGILRLSDDRSIDDSIFDKVVRTICAIANNGHGAVGHIIVGVCDKDADAARIARIDDIRPLPVGTSRKVVGVIREAKVLGESVENYFSRWRRAIAESELSEPLRGDVLSAMKFNDYFGLGVLLLEIPAQTQIALVGNDTYWRRGDETVKANDLAKVAEIATRFNFTPRA